MSSKLLALVPTLQSQAPCGRQALSVTMRKHTLEAAARNVIKLRAAVDKCKSTDANRLMIEYTRLVAGLQVPPLFL